MKLFDFQKFFLFLFILTFCSNIIYAEPILTFEDFISYSINSILISNLNYDRTAEFKLYAYTYDKSKFLIFDSKVKYYTKSFKCYFYINPNYELITLIIIFDNKQRYEYQFNILLNKYAESYLKNFSFNEKYKYEILNYNSSNPRIKISSQYNLNYYSLVASSFLYYYDKKEQNSVSVFSFLLGTIFFILILLINNKKLKFPLLIILTTLFCFYILFSNNQNFELKGYIENPITLDSSNNYLNDIVLIDLNFKYEEKAKGIW